MSLFFSFYAFYYENEYDAAAAAAAKILPNQQTKLDIYSNKTIWNLDEPDQHGISVPSRHAVTPLVVSTFYTNNV